MTRIISLLLSVLAAISVQAQDFDLYFANNLSDVQNLRTVTRHNSALRWTKISNNTIGGNQVDVQKVKDMFAKTAMKGREEQELFWKMRDNTTLCFRINDGREREQAYEVHVVYNEQQPMSMTVSDYFFINLPQATDSVLVKVNKKARGEASTDTLRFRYYAYDWDDRNLYTFRLDSKRQKTGLTYQIEYVLTENGQSPVTKTLDVKGDKFQSFYVPQGKTLSEIYLVSNDQNDVRKLKLDRSKLEYGAWVCQDFNHLKLESNVFMDKHAGRELTIFNMLGTGLMERYDILYLRPYAKNSSKGKERVVKNATIHVERVNEKGEYVPDETVRVLGFDDATQSYKIQTMTNPVLIEILAPDYYPTIYKYAGAFDPVTKVLNVEKCNANVRLFPSSGNSNQIAVSNQTLCLLKEKSGVTRTIGGKNYKGFMVDSIDLSTKSKETEMKFLENGGTDEPKVLNDNLIEKYAQMALTFSVPKSAGNQPTPLFYALEKDNDKAKYNFDFVSRNTILASDHPSLTRNYFELRYDLVGKLPKEIVCKPVLESGDKQFRNFPYLKLITFNKEQAEKTAENQAKDAACKDNDKMIRESAGDMGMQWLLAPSFQLDLTKMPGFSLKLVPQLDLDRGLFDVDVLFSLGFGKSDSADGSEMKQDLKNNSVSRSHTISEEKGSRKISWDSNNDSGALKNLDKNKWFMNEFDDIFKVSGNKLGLGWFVDGEVGVTMPLDPFGFYLKKLEVGAGGGFFGFLNLDPESILRKYIKNETFITFISKGIHLRASAVLSAYGKVGVGMKRYGFEKKFGSLKSGKMGWLAYAEASLKGGVSVSFDADATQGQEPTSEMTPEEKSEVEECQALNKQAKLGGKARVGAKLLLTGGFGGQVGWQSGGEWTSSDKGWKAMALAGFDAFLDIKFYILRWRPRFTACIGGQTWGPENTTNPFYPGYPWWLKGTTPPKVPQRRADDGDIDMHPIDTDNQYLDFGASILSSSFGNPKPLFMSESDVVVNQEQDENNINGDRIVCQDVNNSETAQLSENSLRATTPSVCHAGDYDIVGFEQMKTTLEKNTLTGDALLNKEKETAHQSKLVAQIRKADGSWQQTVIADDNNYIDQSLTVAIQEDGRAAAVWKRGEYVNPLYISKYQIPTFDMKGYVVMSVFDGTQWSEPENLLPIDGKSIVNDLQLVMANDTVLAAIHYTTYPQENDKNQNTESSVWYSCRPLSMSHCVHTIDPMSPISISMERVGDEVVMAMLYEPSDSLRDVYVKMLNMNGLYSGHGATDMNLTQFMPQSMKVVSDKQVDYPNDFCLLWTRMDNTVRIGKETVGFPKPQSILNASRIFMHDNLRPTPYVTVGASRDNLIMTDYDGFLDDNSISVVYGLSDGDGIQESRVMMNTQEFYNDFEYDISYTDKALISTQTLPVNFRLYNTGTSPIKRVSFTINDAPYELTDLYVGPYEQETFTVNYSVPESFNGLLTCDHVECDFDNVFQATYSPRRGASLRRVAKEENTQDLLIGFENVSCELVNHSVDGSTNIYEVELTDHSLYGLQKNHTAYVGIFPHPGYNIPISDDAVVRLTSDDFVEIGGERKAYATLYVEHVEEQQIAFLNTHIYDERLWDMMGEDDDMGLSVIDNLSEKENLWSVQLIPSEEDEQTGLPLISKDDCQHKTTVSREHNGIRLSGLTVGNRLRVFAADGKVEYSATVTADSQLVGLQQHGVYLVSTGEEIFKYNY